jgi:hypothetical protein
MLEGRARPDAIVGAGDCGNILCTLWYSIAASIGGILNKLANKLTHNRITTPEVARVRDRCERIAAIPAANDGAAAASSVTTYASAYFLCILPYMVRNFDWIIGNNTATFLSWSPERLLSRDNVVPSGGHF